MGFRGTLEITYKLFGHTCNVVVQSLVLFRSRDHFFLMACYVTRRYLVFLRHQPRKLVQMARFYGQQATK